MFDILKTTLMNALRSIQHAQPLSYATTTGMMVTSPPQRLALMTICDVASVTT